MNMDEDMRKRDNLYSNKKNYTPPTGDIKFDEPVRKIRVRRSSIRGWRYIRHLFKKEENERHVWTIFGLILFLLILVSYLLNENW
jgi:hypothetical protein